MHTKFDQRMKRYEQVSQTYLVRRCPVIIRLDGKAFHTFTKGFEKPFDKIMQHCMWYTAGKLMENVQGCVLVYTQSDEISLLLVDYKSVNSEAWFDYRVDKLCSIVASMATLYFNSEFAKELVFLEDNNPDIEVYRNAWENGALFDARAFNIPKEDVNNYFVWRQADCKRNSIQGIAQYYFNRNDIKGKNNAAILRMLSESGIEWEDYSESERFGVSKAETGETHIHFMENPNIVNKLVFINE